MKIKNFFIFSSFIVIALFFILGYKGFIKKNNVATVNTAVSTNSNFSSGIYDIWIVDADKNKKVRKLLPEDVINLSQIGTNKITLEVETVGEIPKSVAFDVNGKKRYKIDNTPSFTISSSNSSDPYRPWNAILDKVYTVKATPFSLANGRGGVGVSRTIRFKVISGEVENLNRAATSINITSPIQNTNILTNSTFTVTAQGSPDNSNIARVDFFYKGEFSPVLIGSDMQAPFSVNVNLGGVRGFNCPNLYVKATTIDGNVITSPKVYIITTDSSATAPIANCPNNGEYNDDFYITNPLQGTNINEGQPFNISTSTSVSTNILEKVRYFMLNGNVSQNLSNNLPAYSIQSIGTKNSPPYTFTGLAGEPGNLGGSGNTNIVAAVAYYKNGATNVTYSPIKIIPVSELPSISAVKVVSVSGSELMTLNDGSVVNIGILNGGFGPNITFKADPSLNAPSSVKFILERDDFEIYSRIDNGLPFSMYGETGNMFNVWTNIAPGVYRVKVIPYSQQNATGNQGNILELNFNVVNNDDSQSPTIPTNLVVNYRQTGQVSLSWSPASDPTSGIMGYKIYRNPVHPYPDTITPYTTYLDSYANQTVTYTYRVSSIDNSGNESPLSNPVVANPISTLFPLGTDIVLTQTVDVIASPQYPDPMGQQPSGARGRVTLESVFANGVNYWWVNFDNSTLDGWVPESYMTLAVQPDTTPPDNITTASFTSTSNSITLNWTEPLDYPLPSGGISMYRIYRSNSANGVYDIVNSSIDTFVTDTGLSPNTTYYYKIVAQDNNFNQAPLSSAGVITASTN